MKGIAGSLVGSLVGSLAGLLALSLTAGIGWVAIGQEVPGEETAGRETSASDDSPQAATELPEPPSPTRSPLVDPAGPWMRRLERLLRNPHERTRRAVDAYRAGRLEEAVALGRAARELAPDEPLTGFNSGTVEVAAGLHETAIASFEETVERLRLPEAGEGLHRLPESRFRQPRLAASSLYNLGNAHLAQGDPESAIRAYEDALRLAPGHEDAKHNLELALRELQRRNPPPPQPQEQSEEAEGGSDRSTPELEGPEEGQDETPSAAQPEPEDTQLQDFEDQPDMTAEEAAAILQAVENLERQQRREEAAERAGSSTPGEKDW